MRPETAHPSVLVEDLDADGRGVGVHEDCVLHVAGALPGERATIEIEHRSPHRAEAWARLVALERRSADRRPKVCPATGRCGGCPLGELDYAAQLRWKTGRLERLATALVLPAETLAPIVASPHATGYRGQAKLVYGDDEGRRCLGAYAPRSHALVDLAGCAVVEPVLEEVRAALLAQLRASNVPPHDERTRTGLLSYVVLRANQRGEVLATLVGADLDGLAQIAPPLDLHPALIGIALHRRPEGNAIFGRETRALHGVAELELAVGPVSLRLSPTAFFQVNRAIAARIYADLATWLVPRARGRIVDAYCGVGGIAFTLAAAGARDVLGVEVNEDAVRDASRAAEAQGLAARFTIGDVARVGFGDAVDSIVVNPPRRGLDAATIAAIAQARPRNLAYVSCDPDTLTRDLRPLITQGLRVERITGYDMHPQTPHLESLVLLSRV